MATTSNNSLQQEGSLKVMNSKHCRILYRETFGKTSMAKCTSHMPLKAYRNAPQKKPLTTIEYSGKQLTGTATDKHKLKSSWLKRVVKDISKNNERF